jgi:PAS domain S-box-containing protein
MNNVVAGNKDSPWRMGWTMGGIYLLAATVSEVVAHWFLSWEKAEFSEGVFFLATAVLLAWLVQRNLAAAQRRSRKQQELTQWLSIVGGQEFFPLMAQNLARAVEADCVLICELVGEGKGKLRSLAACCHDRQLEGFECAWADTPAERVLRERRTVCIPQGVGERFSLSHLPPDLIAESFLGTPLFDAGGRIIGLLSLLDAKPLCDRGVEDILSLFAVRAAAELERRRAEEALRQSRDRVQAIIANAFDAVVEMDDGGVITSWNPRAETMFGWPAEEVIGRKPGETIIPERYRKAHEVGLRHFLATGEGPILNRHMEMTARHRDGHEIPVELTVTPVRWGAGYIFNAFLRDISERRQAEEERSRLAAIVDFSDDAIIGKTLDGTIASWNQGAEKLYGYAAAEVIGRPASVLVPPEHRDEMPQLLARIRRGEHLRHYQTDRLGKDGRRIPISLTLSPIKDAVGEIIGASAIARDISEQKEAEQALRESEERFRATFNQAAVGMVHVKPDGRLLRMNQKCCDIFGYTVEELKTKTIADITHPDDLETSMNHIQRLREGKIDSYTLEKRYIRKDRSTVWVDLTVSKVVDEGGRPSFFVGVIEDITERKAAEQALRFSEARYRTLYRDNPIMIATLDADWTMLAVNPACAAQLGYEMEELENQSVLKLFHEDDRAAVAEQLQQCLEAPEQVHRWQFRKVRKDGGLLWVDELAQAAYDLTGAVNIMVVCQDITERRRAQEEIERLNNDLRARAADLEDANRELEAFNYAVAHDLR